MSDKTHIVQMFQSGPEDNAQTALAMALTGLGCPVNPWELRAMESAADLVSQARRAGVYAEGRSMTLQELCSAPLPAIVHWQYRSFVVVNRIRHGRVWISDPEEGLRVLTLEAFRGGFTGVTVCLDGGDKARPERKSPGARTFYRKFPAAAAVLGILQAFLCVCCVGAVLALRLIAKGGGSRPAVLFLTAAALQLGTALSQVLFLRRYEKRLRLRLSENCARELRKKSPLFLKQVQLHQVAYACESCGWAGAAQAELGLQTVRLAGAAVCLTLLGVQDFWAAAAALGPALAWAAVVKRREEALRCACRRAGWERFFLRHQTARQMERTDPLRGENRLYFEQWLSRAGGRTETPEEDRLNWSWYVFCAVELTAVLAACLLRVIQGHMTLEILAGCMGSAAYFTGMLRALIGRTSARAALRSVQETVQELFGSGTAQTRTKTGTLGEEDEVLSAHNIGLPAKTQDDYGYQGVSLSVRRGEVLLVTTDGDRLALSRVLAGIAPPAHGMVCIASTSLRELREEELYRNVVLLGRGLPLPWGTVGENIAAGGGNISDQDVAAAASDALLHRRILLRGEGYGTPASELSEGERVLLEFACAFARRVPFLVVDRCIQVLDPETQGRLLAAARRLGVGTVLVTGGPEPAPWADAVCCIREGRVVLSERSEIVNWEGRNVVYSR